MANQTTFAGQWTKANTLALFISYLIYTPIAHGFTGGHLRELTTSQIIAHTVALFVVALIVFLFQRKVLKAFVSFSSIRLIAAAIAFVTMFWFGYYQSFIPDGPDYDILFSFLVLGVGGWIGGVSFKGHFWKGLLAFFAFPFGSFIGELLLVVTVSAMDIEVDMQSSMWPHMIFWVTVGTITGIVGGWISGKALGGVLEKK